MFLVLLHNLSLGGSASEVKWGGAFLVGVDEDGCFFPRLQPILVFFEIPICSRVAGL